MAQSVTAEVFVNWVNDRLKPANLKVQDIEELTTNVTTLQKLVELLAEKGLPEPDESDQEPLNELAKIQNFLEDEEKLGGFDLNKQDNDAKLNFIWILIERYHIGRRKNVKKSDSHAAPSQATSTKNTVLNWMKAILPDTNTKNLSSNWNDGIRLSMLVNNLKPGIIPNIADLKPEDALSNTDTAIVLAERHFGIPQIIKAEYLCVPNPDQLSVITYLGYFFNKGSQGENVLLNWIREKIPDKPQVSDFSESWKDGSLLVSLIESLSDDVSSEDHPVEAIDKVKKSMEFAKDKLKIKMTITPEEFIDPELDSLPLMTYIAFFMPACSSEKDPSAGKPSETTGIENLKIQLADMKAQFSTKESEVRSLQEQLSEKEEKITTLDARVKEVSEDFQSLQQTNSEMKAQMDEQLKEAKTKISDFENKHQQVSDELKISNENCTTMEEQAKNMTKEIEETKEKIKKGSAEILALEKDKYKKDSELKQEMAKNKIYVEKERKLTIEAKALSVRVSDEMKRFTAIQRDKTLLQKELLEMATRLKVDDLHEVMLLTANIQGQWEDIGNVLKVPHEELDSISTKYSSSVTRCHYEMMRYWIIRIGGSLKGLADALKHNSIKQEDLAKEILDIYEKENNRTAIKIRFQLLKNETKVLKGIDLHPYNIFTDVDWRVLGLLVGLSDSTLESIQIKSSSEEQCQQAMIDQWISTGQAYWSLLVDALEGPVLEEIELASKIAEEHFERDAASGDDGSAIEGTYPINKEKVEEMQEKILTTITSATEVRDGNQINGIMFAFAMTVVKGARIDLNNVTATFEKHLQFAVHRVEDIKGEDLANFIKAAATAKYPLSCKHKAFYFAGHGGIDKSNRPFFKPVAENGSDFFLIRENILAHFQNTKPKDKFMFFFDCCLSQAKSDQDTSTPSDVEFSLIAPVRCVIAFATSAGFQSSGDTVNGGQWTASLCKNLEEKIELGEVLTKTHTDVMIYSENKQPPQYHSCVGPIYLKGMPEPSIQPYNRKDEDSKQNVLKRHHSDLFQILHNNQTVLTSLVTALSMDCIIDKQYEDKIIREKHIEETVTLLLNRLEQKLDNQPEILGKLFERMEHFEGELRTLVIGMREVSKDIDEETITTNLTKALNESKTEIEELKQNLLMLEKEKEQLDEEVVDLKKTGTSLNELKMELREELKVTTEFIHEKQVSFFNDQLLDMEANIRQLNDMLSDKNHKIAHLEDLVKVLNRTKDENETLKEQLIKLEEKRDQQNKQISLLRDTDSSLNELKEGMRLMGTEIRCLNDVLNEKPNPGYKVENPLGAPKIDNEAAIKEHLRTLEHEKKQWDEQILDLKKSTTSLNKLKENLQTEVSGLNSQLQHKEIEMKRLNDKLSNRTQNVSQLEEKLKKASIDVEGSKKACASIKTEMKEKMEQSDKNISHLEEKVIKVTDDLKKSEEVNSKMKAEMKQEIEQRNRKISELEEQIKKVSEGSEESAANMKDIMENLVEQRNKAISDLEEQAKKASETLEESKQNLVKMKAEKEGLIQQTDKIISDLEIQLKEVYEDLEVSNENVTNVKAEMERKIEEKNMTISDLEDKIKRASETLEESKQNLVKMKAEKEGLIQQTDKIISDLEIQLKEVYEDLEVSNENVTNVKAEMEREIEEKNMTISDLEDKIKRVSEDLEVSNENVTNMKEREIEEKNMTISDLEDEIKRVSEDLEVSNENVTNMKVEMKREIEERNTIISDLEDAVKKGAMMNENVLLSQQLEDSKKEMIIKMEEMAVDVNHLKQRLVKSEKEMLEFRMLAQVNERLKTGERPGNWDIMPHNSSGQEVTVHSMELSPGCEEYVEAEKKFNATMVKGKIKSRIHSIRRIQNLILYGQYIAMRKEMGKRNPAGHENERWLFHGTSHTDVNKINAHGFVNRSFRRNNGPPLYGEGIYFARDASSSSGYSRPDENGLKVIYLAQVLTGEYTKGTRNTLIPPPKDPYTDLHVPFDSTVDNVSSPSVFVVYYNSQCYPAYLIKYND